MEGAKENDPAGVPAPDSAGLLVEEPENHPVSTSPTQGELAAQRTSTLEGVLYYYLFRETNNPRDLDGAIQAIDDTIQFYGKHSLLLMTEAESRCLEKAMKETTETSMKLDEEAEQSEGMAQHEKRVFEVSMELALLSRTLTLLMESTLKRSKSGEKEEEN